MNLNRFSDKSTPLFDREKASAFKKYLPASELDKQWGLIINDLGHNRIPANSVYPTTGHPGSHTFSWKSGRVLSEYHFVLITEGEGIFESNSGGQKKINAGDGFMLFPEEWHRYKPLKATGWTESWIGFTGQIAEIIMKDSFFSKKNPVISKCANMLVLNLFKTMFQLIQEEPFGYQRTTSGLCLQLMAEICNIQKGFEHSKHSISLLSKAKLLMHKKIDEDIDFHTFCKNNGISYSKFRFDFKSQTGFAPLQYFMQIKIEKAKDLLTNTELRIKQIAFNLGFKSDHYFSRTFKKRVGLAPGEFRTKSKSRNSL